MVVEEGQEKVSSQEWEEKSEEKGQEHPRTEASSGQAPLEAMEALAALQMELSSVNEKDPKAYLRLQRKDHQRRKVSLELEKCHHPGHPWLRAQSCILTATS